MRDMSRNEEDEVGSRRVFKEEMIRRAEERRSFMMDRNNVYNNGFGGGSKLLSPSGSGHQTKINIKIEREEHSDKGEGKGFQVGRENHFKVNIGKPSEGQGNNAGANPSFKVNIEKVPHKDVFSDTLYRNGAKAVGNSLNDTRLSLEGKPHLVTENIPSNYENGKTSIDYGTNDNLLHEVSSMNNNFSNKDASNSGIDECKCAAREGEKAQLRELNDRHLLLLSEKQGVINCLKQKMETLTQLKEVFIDEDRDKLKNNIDFLVNKIKDAEKQGEEAKKNEALKDAKIEDLEKKIRDLESALEKNKEDLNDIDNLKKENAVLLSAKKADDEKMEWLANERDHDRENFDSFAKKVFTEKWEEILEKVDTGCDGKSYLENVETKLEELRNAFDDRTAFDEMEARYKEQIAALHNNLESEKENIANIAGDNSEMKCKIDILEQDLEALKKENQQTKDELAAEKIASARELAEKEAEANYLKNLVPNLSQHGKAGVSSCVNNLPVNLAQELGVYSKILDALGEEKENENVEKVYERTIHRQETTKTYQNGHDVERKHLEEKF